MPELLAVFAIPIRLPHHTLKSAHLHGTLTSRGLPVGG